MTWQPQISLDSALFFRCSASPCLGCKVREYHTERTVHFVVRMDGSRLKNAEEKEGIDAVMRLKSTINETNMVLFDHEGRITKYKSAKAIMDEFAKVRLKMLHDCSKKRVELIPL